MPELPEVQTVVNVIAPVLTGKTIQSVQRLAGTGTLFGGGTEAEMNAFIAGQTIREVTRRAKYIVWRLDHGMLLIHLRMTGRLVFARSPEEQENHFTAVFQFTDGTELWFKDYRKFGRITFAVDPEHWDDHLGPEPLSTEFTPVRLATALHAHHRQIKPLLLDQSVIAGLGNIYVDEALWEARIHPQTRSDRVSRPATRRLHRAIQSILTAAVAEQGTTIVNFYFGEGQSGNFRQFLKVFDRAGEPCPRCTTALRKIKVAQRGTHFCPKCQRKR